MRNYFIALLCLLASAFLLPSCTNNAKTSPSEPVCWRVLWVYDGMEIDWYVWLTEEELEVELKEIVDGDGYIKYKGKTNIKSQQACRDADKAAN